VCCYLLACLIVSNSLYCVCALIDLLFLPINDVERLFNRPCHVLGRKTQFSSGRGPLSRLTFTLFRYALFKYDARASFVVFVPFCVVFPYASCIFCVSTPMCVLLCVLRNPVVACFPLCFSVLPRMYLQVTRLRMTIGPCRVTAGPCCLNV